MKGGAAWRAGLLSAAASFAAVSTALEIPPLRDIPRDKVHEVRVLYLEDPRLPSLGQEQLLRLEARLEALVPEFLGFKVRFKDLGRRDLRAFFDAHAEVFAEHRGEIEAMDLDPGKPADRRAIRSAIRKDFGPRDLALIREYFPGRELKDKRTAARAAYRVFLERLRAIRAIPALDGKPLSDPARRELTLYPYWTFLQFGTDAADLLLTNTVVAGADDGMPIYVIARGGISTGITNNNLSSPLQGNSLVGLLPFLSDAPFFLKERGPIPEEERLEVIATFTLHELGHLLGRYVEYYDHPGCVHVAPKGLRYLEWHREVRRSGRCAREHKKLRRY